MPGTMKQVLLTARPQGFPKSTDFAVEEAPIPTAGPDQMLLKTLWLSVDPFMRLGLDEKPLGGNNGVPLDSVMIGDAVSEVIESNVEGYAKGDFVIARSGWREYATIGAGTQNLRKIEPTKNASLSGAIGALGMPGQTSYAGMVVIGRIKEGETVVISAAAGAVGIIAGQIGKLKGARVVGIAGGAEKCAAVVAAGFDACIDYKAADFEEKLKAAVPEGIDLYFDNVGGDVTQTVLPLVKYGARWASCGFIANYDVPDFGPGPDRMPWLLRMIMLKGLEIRGFNGAFVGGKPALDQMRAWVEDGSINIKQTVFEGVENAPVAFESLFKSNANIGKVVIKVAADA
jgi:NADPH-dependent curcumin reductase CurA